jgi:hypothetical protein
MCLRRFSVTGAPGAKEEHRDRGTEKEHHGDQEGRASKHQESRRSTKTEELAENGMGPSTCLQWWRLTLWWEAAAEYGSGPSKVIMVKILKIPQLEGSYYYGY